MDFVEPIDQGTFYWFQGAHTPWLNEVMVALTRLGNTPVLTSVAVLGAVAFALRGQLRTAGVIVAVALLGLALEEAGKNLVGRPRPVVPENKRLVPWPPSTSFPSGHALNSMSIYGALGLLASRRVRRRALAALVAVSGLVLAMLIGVTRMYLGVHYLSDVVGGWTGGLACALLAYWADRRWSAPGRSTLPAAPPPTAPGARAPQGHSEGVVAPPGLSGVRVGN
jgi:undecaprenyl-diphosphatase